MITEWTSFASASIVALILFAIQTWIVTHIKRGVEHRFARDLETMRAEHHTAEEGIKAALREKEGQLAALRTVALTGVIKRQATLAKRRVEAIDQLWSAVASLGPAKGAAALVQGINFEEASRVAAKNEKARAMFAGLAAPYAAVTYDLKSAMKARPFVSPMAWAIYSAYQAVVLLGITKLNVLKTGIDGKGLLNLNSVSELITTVLPHRADYVRARKDAAYYPLLDELETTLLDELKRMLSGAAEDSDSVARAAAIVRQAERVRSDLTGDIQQSNASQSGVVAE